MKTSFRIWTKASNKNNSRTHNPWSALYLLKYSIVIIILFFTILESIIFINYVPAEKKLFFYV